MKTLLPLLLLVGLSACHTITPRGTDHDLAATLIALERTWAEAELAADTTTMRRLLADDLVATTFYGVMIQDVDAVVAAPLDPALSLRTIQQSDLQVKRLGPDLAMVTGRADMDWAFNNTPLPAAMRYTRLYQHQRGTWKVIAVHVSPVVNPLRVATAEGDGA